MTLDVPTPLHGAAGAPLGLTATLFAVPGKVPLYLERPGEAPPIVQDGTTVGAAISDGAHTLFFIPGCAAMTPALRRAAARRGPGAASTARCGTMTR